MRFRRFLFTLCGVVVFTGCGTTLAVDETEIETGTLEDLVAILAQKGSADPSLLNSRKRTAIETLAKRGSSSFTILYRVAQDKSQHELVRFAAAEAIGGHDPLGEEQIPALLKLRREKWGAAINDLLEQSCLAASTEVVVPLLVAYVRDDRVDYENRQSVARILSAIDESAASTAGIMKKVDGNPTSDRGMPDVRPIRP